MIARATNLIIAIVMLAIVTGIANPALYRIGTMITAMVAFAITAAAIAWVIYAYHLVTLKWYQNMVDRGRRVDSGAQ